MPYRKLLNWIRKLFSKKKQLKLGLVGTPNSGKTTLANRICMDYCNEEMGATSKVPHETRVVQSMNEIEVKSGKKSLVLDLFDTPGLSKHDDLFEYYRHFIAVGLSRDDSDKRLRESMKGIQDTIKLIKKLDAVIFVVDLTHEPWKQVSDILLDILHKEEIPVIIAANKIDLIKEKAPMEEYDFLGYPVVPISAFYGTNMTRFYKTIYKHLK